MKILYPYYFKNPPPSSVLVELDRAIVATDDLEGELGKQSDLFKEVEQLRATHGSLKSTFTQLCSEPMYQALLQRRTLSFSGLKPVVLYNLKERLMTEILQHDPAGSLLDCVVDYRRGVLRGIAVFSRMPLSFGVIKTYREFQRDFGEFNPLTSSIADPAQIEAGDLMCVRFPAANDMEATEPQQAATTNLEPVT